MTGPGTNWVAIFWICEHLDLQTTEVGKIKLEKNYLVEKQLNLSATGLKTTALAMNWTSKQLDHTQFCMQSNWTCEWLDIENSLTGKTLNSAKIWIWTWTSTESETTGIWNAWTEQKLCWGSTKLASDWTWKQLSLKTTAPSKNWNLEQVDLSASGHENDWILWKLLELEVTGWLNDFTFRQLDLVKLCTHEELFFVITLFQICVHNWVTMHHGQLHLKSTTLEFDQMQIQLDHAQITLGSIGLVSNWTQKQPKVGRIWLNNDRSLKELVLTKMVEEQWDLSMTEVKHNCTWFDLDLEPTGPEKQLHTRMTGLENNQTWEAWLENHWTLQTFESGLEFNQNEKWLDFATNGLDRKSAMCWRCMHTVWRFIWNRSNWCQDDTQPRTRVTKAIDTMLMIQWFAQGHHTRLGVCGGFNTNHWIIAGNERQDLHGVLSEEKRLSSSSQSMMILLCLKELTCKEKKKDDWWKNWCVPTVCLSPMMGTTLTRIELRDCLNCCIPQWLGQEDKMKSTSEERKNMTKELCEKTSSECWHAMQKSTMELNETHHNELVLPDNPSWQVKPLFSKNGAMQQQQSQGFCHNHWLVQRTPQEQAWGQQWLWNHESKWQHFRLPKKGKGNSTWLKWKEVPTKTGHNCMDKACTCTARRQLNPCVSLHTLAQSGGQCWAGVWRHDTCHHGKEGSQAQEEAHQSHCESKQKYAGITVDSGCQQSLCKIAM